MNIGEFLCLKGIELSDILANVDAAVGLGTGDVLLAVGSLAEGLGNSKSDLDLLWITPRSERSLPAQDHLTLLIGKCLIDVRILRLTGIEEMLARFEKWSQLPWNVTHAVKFTLDERTLLHRLLHGHVLYRGKKERVMSRLPPLIDMARLKLQVARQMARTIQVDMVGSREVGDFSSLVFAAQELLGHAVDALLAGYQLTNPLSKWRSRMLLAVPSDWESSLGIRPTGRTASQQMWHLHRAPERPDETLALEHALRITTFARAVFRWAELHLVQESAAKQKPLVWPQRARQPQDYALPYLDFDVDFFLAERRVIVARLNEFDETLKMSPREFALTLLFDGTTTVREAKLIANGHRRGKARSSIIERLLTQITRAGFSVSPEGKLSPPKNGQNS
jgi:hypothetical protein